ncbi:Hypothetical predicted protein [Podarcis lilfordi]|uniref:Uncharacterized protein n=1 Tax=Podarcis lilfordi TaxID=74358 RepID=A0AA35JTL4_9SAUR|nr:Hypothetical predicted protein [Podarcis lilfordi]
MTERLNRKQSKYYSLLTTYMTAYMFLPFSRHFTNLFVLRNTRLWCGTVRWLKTERQQQRKKSEACCPAMDLLGIER